MFPITGPAAFIGQEQLNWASFAVDRWNAENGTSFEFTEGDTMLDPAEGAVVAEQFLADDSILAIVGPASSPVVEAAAAVIDGQIAYVSPSSTQTDITLNTETFFRVVPTDDDQGPTAANFMIDQLGAQKVLIIDDQTSYSTGLADFATSALEEAGVTVDRESVSQDQTDFSALVSTIADDTDVVFLPWQLAANAQLFADQMVEQGKTAALFGSDGTDTPEFTAEGAYVSVFAPIITTIDDPEIQGIIDEYNATVGEEFGTFGPPSYLAAEVLMAAAQSICEAGEEPTRESMIEAVRATNFPTSIIGEMIAFDEAGDVTPRKFFILQIQNGEKVVVA